MHILSTTFIFLSFIYTTPCQVSLNIFDGRVLSKASPQSDKWKMMLLVPDITIGHTSISPYPLFAETTSYNTHRTDLPTLEHYCTWSGDPQTPHSYINSKIAAQGSSRSQRTPVAFPLLSIYKFYCTASSSNLTIEYFFIRALQQFVLTLQRLNILLHSL